MTSTVPVILKMEKSKKGPKVGKPKKSKSSKKKGPIIVSQDVPLSSESSSSTSSDAPPKEQKAPEPADGYLDYRFRCHPRSGVVTQVSLQRGEFIPQITLLTPKHIRVIDGSIVPDFDYNQVINHFFRIGNTVSFSGSITLRVSKKCQPKNLEPSGILSFLLKVPIGGAVTASGVVTTLWFRDHTAEGPLSCGVGFIKTSPQSPDSLLLSSPLDAGLKLGGSWCTFSYHIDYTLTPGS